MDMSGYLSGGLNIQFMQVVPKETKCVRMCNIKLYRFAGFFCCFFCDKLTIAVLTIHFLSVDNVVIGSHVITAYLKEALREN